MFQNTLAEKELNGSNLSKDSGNSYISVMLTNVIKFEYECAEVQVSKLFHTFTYKTHTAKWWTCKWNLGLCVCVCVWKYWCKLASNDDSRPFKWWFSLDVLFRAVMFAEADRNKWIFLRVQAHTHTHTHNPACYFSSTSPAVILPETHTCSQDTRMPQYFNIMHWCEQTFWTFLWFSKIISNNIL